MNLFDISQEYEALMNEIVEAGGELNPELEERLTISEAQVKDKLHAYHHVIASSIGDINTLKEEIERLTAKRRSIEKLVVKLKEIIKDAVLRFGNNKPKGEGKFMKYPTLHLYTTTRPSVEIINEDEIPNKYKFGKISIDVDTYNRLVQDDSNFIDPSFKVEVSKSRLKDALAIAEVSGAKLGTSISITMK